MSHSLRNSEVIFPESFKEKTSFLWTIDDFSELCFVDNTNSDQLCFPTKSESLKSPVFIRGQKVSKDSEWYLEMYQSEKSPGNISLFVILEKVLSDQTKEVKGTIACFIVDASGKKLYTKEKSPLRIFREGYVSGIWGWNSFISLEALTETCNVEPPETPSSSEMDNYLFRLMPGNTLRILVEMEVYGTSQELQQSSVKSDNSKISKAHIQLNPAPNVTQSVAKLWESKIHSDINIQSGDKIIPAHKTILLAQSEVFAHKFKSGKEIKEGNLILSNLDENSLEKMLEFIYTGEIQDINWTEYEKVDALLEAATNYKLEPLKTRCHEKLCENLNVSNFVPVSKLIFNYEADAAFQKQIHLFYTQNLELLTKDNNFQMFVKKNADHFWKLIIVKDK